MRCSEAKIIQLPLVLSDERRDENANWKSCSHEDHLQTVFIYTGHVTKQQWTGFPPCNKAVLDKLT